MSSVSQVVDAFELLYSGLRDPGFRKSLPLDKWSEKQLLPLVRTFLLGYFGPKARPEFGTVLPGGLTGYGRVDFLIYGVAVEFAVRRPPSGMSEVGFDAARQPDRGAEAHEA